MHLYEITICILSTYSTSLLYYHLYPGSIWLDNINCTPYFHFHFNLHNKYISQLGGVKPAFWSSKKVQIWILLFKLEMDFIRILYDHQLCSFLFLIIYLELLYNLHMFLLKRKMEIWLQFKQTNICFSDQCWRKSGC